MSPKNFQSGKISHKSGHTGGGGDVGGGVRVVCVCPGGPDHGSNLSTEYSTKNYKISRCHYFGLSRKHSL